METMVKGSSGHESTYVPNVPFGYSSDVRGNQCLLYYHEFYPFPFDSLLYE
jgi:hypothetical protein